MLLFSRRLAPDFLRLVRIFMEASEKTIQRTHEKHDNAAGSSSSKRCTLGLRLSEKNIPNQMCFALICEKEVVFEKFPPIARNVVLRI